MTYHVVIVVQMKKYNLCNDLVIAMTYHVVIVVQMKKYNLCNDLPRSNSCSNEEI